MFDFDITFFQSVQFIVFRSIAAIIAVTLHKYTKAATSWRLGDNLPKLDGRLSINPFKHIEPLGFLLLLLWGYGWGKPLETSPMYYSNAKRGTMLVNALPIVVNVLISVMAGVAAFTVNHFGYGSDGAAEIAVSLVYGFFYHVAIINAGLAFINVLPIYPLGGWFVFEAILNTEAKIKMRKLRRYMQALLIVIIISGFAGLVFSPMIDLIVGFAR